MPPVIDMKALRKEDNKWKPRQANVTSQKLAQLFEDQASTLTVDYLRTLGLGNKKNTAHPFQASMMKRLIESLSVVYSVPALRTLVDADGNDYDDDAKETKALTGAFERSLYDLLWMKIDATRNLFRTVAVEWIEDDEMKGVSCYVFAPHLVLRWPDPNAPFSLERDKYVALQIRWSNDPRDNLYRVWVLNDDGSRSVLVVNNVGELSGDQPYGNGQSPYGSLLPVQLVYDEHPLGEAWLPVPESRVAWALGLNGAINDLAFLVQMEAHSIKFFKSEMAGTAPTETGPDAVVEAVGEDAELKVLANQPKIQESTVVIDQMLRIWSLSEYLAGDTFTTSTKVLTGQALKVKDRDLTARRVRQAALVPWQERQAWMRYLAIHNRNAGAWSVPKLPSGTTLRVSPGRTWQPVDTVELQNVLFKDLALGFISRIDYRMERFGETRPQAIAALLRVKDDNKRFPLTDFQNPMAVVDQKSAGAAPGSATKNPGAMNPQLTTASEGASVTSTAINNLSGGRTSDRDRD